MAVEDTNLLGGIIHVPGSAYAKEMTKWEAQNSVLGHGLRPYLKRDYPMMLHKAALLPQGGIAIVDTQVVDDADARTRWEAQGFRATPLEAIDGLKAQQLEFSKLAAERTFETRRMSRQAQAEVDQAEAESSDHLPTIPEKPIRRRGRPKKQTKAEPVSAA